MANLEIRDAFYSWYAQYLKDRGLQFTRSGSKSTYNEKHKIDPTTGYWIDPNYSGSKPIRWLVRVNPFTEPITAAVPQEHRANRLGHANTAQGDKAGVAIRLIPIIAKGEGQFETKDDWEVTFLFCFADAVAVGSAAETFDFDVVSGQLTYLGAAQSYIFVALLSMVPRSETMAFDGRTVTYGDVIDAIAKLIKVAPAGTPIGSVQVYDLTQATELMRLRKDVMAAYDAAPDVLPRMEGAATEAHDADVDEAIGVPPTSIEIPEDKNLIGIDPSVYRQINSALKSGKRHLMFYGPPGTGKTALARHVAETLSPGRWTMITGSADWSSQDIIGGYQPVGGGEVAFQRGVLLRAFSEPLIIDEMNRCDIDRVLGPLFTVLSGQHTTLPYRVDIAEEESAQYVILAAEKAAPALHEFAPGSAWRLLATINSIDKASLYQMSYALSRRFGWIYVDAPADLRRFIVAHLEQVTGALPEAPATAPCPIAIFWEAVNRVRPIGPAPIIDAVASIRIAVPDAVFFGDASGAMREAALDAIDMVVFPMLDGILAQDAVGIAEAMTTAFKLEEPQANRIASRLRSLSV